MQKIVLLLVAVAVILGAGYVLWMMPTEDSAAVDPFAFDILENESESVPGDIDEGPVVDPEFHELVTYTASGYSPREVTIRRGQTVRWVNNSNEETWPASAMHPTHTVYPGSDIQKCGTGEQGGIFDACRGLSPGEFWEFTFDEVGSWGYHDHLHASHTGRIIVTE
ncbi:hypothetical protein COU20_01260 [Candidatus Kaiserbacteria bacterium CG10_big_fil_rev_8_21_14_0_10_59_10]|uniref:Plastocyanin-like domain-containing protein n=1 Tax=Candidatus Kaiserbacteria bacterium CG10_big_fil_rev_8_21_14_0_10_59_10 TaxID=1974612 RepID=A0A2H0U8B1_9BACT|nr:MAG: hypothetical protein COU20_01260 [Candidatus Kaiserbacteria bacterium CG10_big_fil_rev_8_21_14_0_10_59_10]